MDDLPKRPNHGELVPNFESMMRACKPHPVGSPIIDDTDFAFEPPDEREDPPQLSVYARSKTIPEDLKVLIGPRVEYAGVLTAEQIISTTHPNSPAHLIVKWTTSYYPPDGDAIDVRQGADGHCSIIGLDLPKPQPGSKYKKERKDIRRQLAEIAIRNGILKI